ncbi:MAG: redoxin family protein [Crocinitomicaceae bacterium]
MKKITLIALLFFVAACGSDNEVENTNESQETTDTTNTANFTLSGTVSGAADQVLYIEAATNRGIMLIGKGASDANGAFSISANIQGYGEYYLRMGESNENVVPMVLVPGDNINFTSNANSFIDSAKFSGTSWSETATEFIPVYQAYSKEVQNLRTSMAAKSELDQLEASIRIKKPVETFAFEQMANDPANPYNLILFKIAGPTFDNFIGWDAANVPLFGDVYSALEKQHPNSPIIRAMGMQVQQMKEMESVVNGEMEAPEISLPNPQGKEMKLSDLRGKYVLVDFWASWCGPCRRENPNVKRIYNTYKNKGFTIFSVSLDENPEHWKIAIEKDGLNWPYHVSDLKRWQSPLPQIYGFDGIPYTVLVNKEGKIIAKGLRGATLEWKLKELL